MRMSTRSLAAAAAAAAAALVGAAVPAPADASFPGANGLIAFVTDRDTAAGAPLNDEIYVIDPDGSQRRLTNAPRLDQFPAVSPNGKEIVFNSNRNDAVHPNPEGDTELYVMDVSDDDGDGNGDNLRRLTDDAANQSSPAWSPGGQKIAYASPADGDSDVYVMDADGIEPPVNLTTVPGEPTGRFDGQPVFSPDGSRIAFISTRDGNNETYLMSADGTGQTRVTTGPAADTQPEFSPDGERLAFTSNRDGDFDIYVLRAEPESASNPATNLTDASILTDRYPAWSPDGTRIAYWVGSGSGLAPDAEIYVMDADGTNPVNLTATERGDIQPDWGPSR